eukprot:gene26001-34602_t
MGNNNIRSYLEIAANIIDAFFKNVLRITIIENGAYYFIKNPETGKVLDIAGGKSANGTKIIAWEKHGGRNQIWEINPDGTISNPQSGKVLDISGIDQTTIVLYDKHGGENQKWVITEDGTIVNPQSGKAFNIKGRGNNIILGTKHGRANQQWILEPAAV